MRGELWEVAAHSRCGDVFAWIPDMIKRRNLRTRNIKVLVLDEADEMLNKGIYSMRVKCSYFSGEFVMLFRIQGTDL